VLPAKVAVTLTVVAPGTGPAVRFTLGVDLASRLAAEPFNVQAYVIPDVGHGFGAQSGAASNCWTAPGASTTLVGVIVRDRIVSARMVTVTEARREVPLSVALTVATTLPPAVPAVRTVIGPVGGASVAFELFSVQLSPMPVPGQGDGEQAGVAERTSW
jgi:hypothetical protein